MKLRPCPFCGNEAIESEIFDDSVICSNEYCEEYNYSRKIQSWNTRQIEDELINVLEELIEIFPGKNGAGDFSREQRVWSLVKKALAKYKGESNG